MDIPEIKGYKILQPLGEGGMAMVYLALQENFQRKVAFKILAQNLLSEGGFGERFLREARIVAQLSHQHIVPVYDVGQQGDIHYIAMELLPGGDLKGVLRKGIPLSKGIKVVKQIASALDYAASRGYVHRDIKPENILFRDDGSAVVCDFGIARSTDSKTNMTLTGTVIGTPHYMSPEQAQAIPLDGRSDLYSAGVIFFEMITGHVPFTADSAISIGIKHITDPVPLLPEDKQEFQDFIDKALAKHPDDRFQTGQEFIDALESLEQELQGDFNNTVVLPSKRKTGSRNSGAVAVSRTANRVARSDTSARNMTVARESTARGTIAREKVAAETSVNKPIGANKSKRGVLALTIASVVALGGGGAWYTWQTQSNLPLENTPAVVKSPVFNQKTKALIDQAQTALIAGRLYQPQGNNAQYFYTTALALAPNDTQATLGIERLVTLYLDNAQSGMNGGELGAANDWLNRSFQIAFYVRDADILERQQALRGELFQGQQENIRLAERDRQIGSELEQAQQAFDADRLTSPVGDNAYDIYQSVLTLEPDNLVAKQGVSKIAAEYMRQAKEQAEGENFIRARALLAAAVQIDSLHPDLSTTQSFIVAQEESQVQRTLAQEVQLAEKASLAVQQSRQEALRNKVKKIEDLLASAASDYKSNRLQSPVGNNAVEKYQQILALDPSNLDALEGLQNVGERYVELARKAIAEKRLSESQINLNVAQRLVPSSPNLSTARRELIAAKESLAQQTDLIRQQEQEIASLLGGAEQDAAAGRLFSPASSNALLKYRQALSIDDTNADALKGRKVVVGKILAAVNDDIKNGRFIEAKGKIVTVAQFVPNDAAIKTSQLSLDRAQKNYKRNQQTIRSLELQASRLKSQTIPSDPKLIVIYRSLLDADNRSELALNGLKKAGRYEVDMTLAEVSKRNFDEAERHLSNADSYGVLVKGIESARLSLTATQRVDRQVRDHASKAKSFVEIAIADASNNQDGMTRSLQSAYEQLQLAKQTESNHPVVAPAEQVFSSGYITLISQFTDEDKFESASSLIEKAAQHGLSAELIQPYKTELDEKKARSVKLKRSSQNMNFF